jgi:hypothetical protein
VAPQGQLLAKALSLAQGRLGRALVVPESGFTDERVQLC